MQTQFIGFNLLKQAVSIEQVFERYGLLERFHRIGDSLTGACPIHGGHNRSQFRVSLTRNLWICFGDCQGGGSIVDFVSRMEGTSVREAGLMIQEWFGVDGSRPMVQRAPVPAETVSANPVLGSELGGLDPEHPYLKERGLSSESIATFGLGHCRKGWLTGWIAIPIHNAEGELVAYAGRWPGIPSGEQPRYRVPRGFHKSWELFNLHRARKEDPREPLIVVEGFFGCMKVWQACFRRVVAVMGLGDAQIQFGLAQGLVLGQHDLPGFVLVGRAETEPSACLGVDSVEAATAVSALDESVSSFHTLCVENSVLRGESVALGCTGGVLPGIGRVAPA